MSKKLVGNDEFNKLFNKKSDCRKLNNQICIIKTLQNKFVLIYLLKDKNGLGLYDLVNKKEIKVYKYLHKGPILCIVKYYRNNQFYILTSSMDNSVNIYNFKETEIKKIIKIDNVGDNKSIMNYFNIDCVLLINNNNKDYLITTNFYDKYIKIYNIFNLNNNDLNNKDKPNSQLQSKYFSERGVFYINTIYHNIKKTNYLIILYINFLYNKLEFNNRSSIDIIDFNTYEKYDNNNTFPKSELIKNFEIYEENNKKFIYFANYNEVYRYDFYKKRLSTYKIKNQILCICLIDKNHLIYSYEKEIISLRVLDEEKFCCKGEKTEKKFLDKVYNITAEKLWDDKMYLFVHLKNGSILIYHYDFIKLNF